MPQSSDSAKVSVVEEILHHALTKGLVEGADGLLINEKEPGGICYTGPVAKDPKEVKEVDKGDVAVVE